MDDAMDPEAKALDAAEPSDSTTAKAPPPGLIIKRANRDAQRFARIASRLDDQVLALRELGDETLADRLGAVAKAAREVASSAQAYANKTAAFRNLSKLLPEEVDR